MSRDFIPSPDLEFLEWIRNLLSQLATASDAWGIPSPALDELQTLAAAFETAMTKIHNPTTRTMGNVLAKTLARKELTPKVRAFLREYVTYNSSIGDIDRKAMQLPIHKKTRTPSAVANTYPWMQLTIPCIRRLQIVFRRSEAVRARPPGQRGIEVRGKIGAKPRCHSELTLTYYVTSSPLTIDFRGEDRGKTFWFASRWINTRGQKGPWSNIMSGIIV
jgi:hypothetical protein